MNYKTRRPEGRAGLSGRCFWRLALRDGSYAHSLVLPGKGSQRRAIDAGDYFLDRVGDAVFITRGADARAIERAPVGSLLRSEIAAPVHHGDVAGPIKIQIPKMHYGPTLDRVSGRIGSIGS